MSHSDVFRQDKRPNNRERKAAKRKTLAQSKAAHPEFHPQLIMEHMDKNAYATLAQGGLLTSESTLRAVRQAVVADFLERNPCYTNEGEVASLV
jgi:hypothetical protein